jgi:membrane-associated protein
VPIVRTFSPFTAGVARMSYRKFLAYDIGGGALWIGLFLGVGYALGNVTWVQNNFEIIVPVIIVVSLLPIAWEVVAAKLRARKASAARQA